MEEPVLSDTATTYLPPPSLATSSSSYQLSALEIPEIMATIFEYLDDETVNRTLILVCRQWFIWNRYRIFRDLYWNSDQTREELGRNDLSKLRLGPDRLFCNVREGLGGDSDPAVVKWKELVDALTSACPLRKHVRAMEDAQRDSDNIGGGEESQEDEEKGVVDAVVDNREDSNRRSKAGDDRKRVIRYLTITGNIQIDKHIREILSGLIHLTSLTVKVDSGGWISMHKILYSCPHLESLHLETAWVHIPETNWLMTDIAPDRFEATTTATTITHRSKNSAEASIACSEEHQVLSKVTGRLPTLCSIAPPDPDRRLVTVPPTPHAWGL
ncbi:hypothetical protein BGZ96_006836 [Linnemannia gamsii]|uniref:F-box domain-containing protein n=1 Tax=Linnemannia gamsii TaxID=64522 RepID=A0ABQ7K291_9FUNG|nr:hypothetical protein BGZ96_006836 [Linnemannia gamsii]